MFELYQRDGHSKQKIASSEALEEIAEVAAEKSGLEFDDEAAFDLGVFDDG